MRHRIAAEPKVMLRPHDRSVKEIIHAESAEADIVFLGLDVPDDDKIGAYAERLADIGEPLRTVFYVKNASLFVGELIESSDSLLRSSSEEEEQEKKETAGVPG